MPKKNPGYLIHFFHFALFIILIISLTKVIRHNRKKLSVIVIFLYQYHIKICIMANTKTAYLHV